MTKDEALKLALEALLHAYHEDEAHPKTLEVITAIDEALSHLKQELTTTLEASVHAGLDKKNDKNPQVDHQGKQPEQEPVANYCKECLTYNGHHEGCGHYTTSPQRKLLTDELYNELLFAVGNKYPNETRHQTALRYILQAEKGDEKAVHGIKE